jgi:hypothetical protein
MGGDSIGACGVMVTKERYSSKEVESKFGRHVVMTYWRSSFRVIGTINESLLLSLFV